MATRADIRDAVYSEMASAAGTYDVTDESGTAIETVTLDEANITLRNPELEEEVPQVVYHENYRPVTYNDVGRAPHGYERDNNGNATAALYHEFVEAQFIIDVRVGGDLAEMRKEPIYETLRTSFGKYEHAHLRAEDLHEDAVDVSVMDSTTADTGDVESVIRGDQLEVRVTFKRVYRHEAPYIDSVDTSVDADSDGTAEDTYTTNN